jgi:hypothetical protein
LKKKTFVEGENKVEGFFGNFSKLIKNGLGKKYRTKNLRRSFLSPVNPWVKIILTPRNKSIIKNKMVKNAYVLLAVFL